MQLEISIELEEPLSLPIGYNYILQSAIYNLGRSDDNSVPNLHKEGASYGNHNFRLFCFSLLCGKYKTSNNRIIFFGTISFEVRSTEIDWLDRVMTTAIKEGIRLGNRVCRVKTVKMSQLYILNNEISVRMKTPISVHTTDEDNRCKYYSPFENEFYELIKSNYYNKYYSYFGKQSEDKLEIEPVQISEKDKVVTKYKNNFYITSWGGNYRIKGSLDALNLLYDLGLGTRNSQGFGMMEILDGGKR